MKSKRVLWIFIILLVLLVIALSILLCIEKNNYKLTFNLNGGQGKKSMLVKKDTEIKLPKPTKEGFIFVGWSSGSQNETVGKTIEVNRDLKLQAVWKEKADPNKKYTCPDGYTLDETMCKKQVKLEKVCKGSVCSCPSNSVNITGIGCIGVNIMPAAVSEK
ncbi:MAG: InlB B-repeat-containing protein [Mollicutes bacterium]|nr:InlB B-repeat-containing protein [Mollicutes bacterium]